MSGSTLRAFQFLLLPVEVRLRIYGFLFADAELYIRDGAIDLDISQGPLAICLANRDIYNESIDELYSSVVLTYEQLYRSIGPGDLPLAPHCRKLIKTLVLVRKCHWTQFKVNWSVLKSYTNLTLLILEDDSLFIYSNADGHEDLQANIEDIRSGLADESIVDILEDTLYDTKVQQLPMIRGLNFNALVQRASAIPPRPFPIEYRKIGTLIDIYDNHIIMTMAYDADTKTICGRKANYKTPSQADQYWHGRQVPPLELQHIRFGRAKNW